MSTRLEDFIRANKDEFNELEPRNSMWNKIEDQLNFADEAPKKREARTFSLNFVLRMAAIIVMVMGTGFILYLRNEKNNKLNLAAINPVYAKEQVQYASLVKQKRSELKQLTKSDPQLYQEFSSEIAQMDSTYKKLNHELATSPNQERVLRAMIRNLQVQTEVLNQQLQAIEQYNQFKEEQKNDTKDI